MEVEENYLLREASPVEASLIAELVNRAFAVERFFKSGDRTSPEQIAKMLGDGNFLAAALRQRTCGLHLREAER